MSEIVVAQGDRIVVGADRQAVLSVVSIADLQGPVGGIPLATGFRLPMQNVHLAWYEYARCHGSYAGHPPARDWNLETMGNTDLGEPLVAPWSGIVITATNIGGSVGRVIQLLGVTPAGEMVLWAGWHLHTIEVSPGQVVQVGELIGSIGNADGRYAGAHLHEQIAVVNGSYGIPSPATFTTDTRYQWRDPLEFYVEHGVDPALVEHASLFDGG